MIKNFKTNDDFLNYIRDKHLKLMSQVTEGNCYKSNDGYVYKVYGIDALQKVDYNLDDVITTDDIKLDSFAFPEKLYVKNKEVLGCKMPYCGKDLFNVYITSDLENINLIDFNKFSVAYKKMLKDVYILSEHNIQMYDLLFNIIFDGDKFTGIDTLGYKKVEDSPLKSNVDMYNYALEGIFKMWFDDFDDDNLVIKNNDVDDFLNKVEDKLNLYGIDYYNKPKIKVKK